MIGKRGKHIRKEDVSDYVLGYTIGNDVSERSWQKSDRTAWRAKNSDTLINGPWIETDIDPAAMRTLVRVNGQETTSFSTSGMLFGVDTFISAISEYVTLQPGDMIWMVLEGSTSRPVTWSRSRSPELASCAIILWTPARPANTRLPSGTGQTFRRPSSRA